jgi:hypothetical protein
VSEVEIIVFGLVAQECIVSGENAIGEIEVPHVCGYEFFMLIGSSLEKGPLLILILESGMGLDFLSLVESSYSDISLSVVELEVSKEVLFP